MMISFFKIFICLHYLFFSTFFLNFIHANTRSSILKNRTPMQLSFVYSKAPKCTGHRKTVSTGTCSKQEERRENWNSVGDGTCVETLELQ